MTRFRLSVLVIVGLVGLSAPAGAAANNSVWRYVVTSARGSATWGYSGPNGSGVDTVTFQGRAPRGIAKAAAASGMLRGRTTYTDQNSNGCGPVTHTKTMNYRSLSFSMPASQAEVPYVLVTWNFPFPDQSFCDPATPTNLGQQLQGLLVEKAALAGFTCQTMSLVVSGRAQVAQGATTGTLSFEATVTIQRPPDGITVST